MGKRTRNEVQSTSEASEHTSKKAKSNADQQAKEIESVQTSNVVQSQLEGIDKKKRREERKLRKSRKNATDGELPSIVDPDGTNGANKEGKTSGSLEKKESKKERASSIADVLVPGKANNSSKGTSNLQKAYREDQVLADLPQADIDLYLAENSITISDPLTSSAILRPLTKFAYLPSTNASQAMLSKEFEAPTPIQATAWPFLLSGRDMIGVAETGSGKTMAFAIPCLQYISCLSEKKRNKGARALVVSPTRELAIQSYEQIEKFAKASKIQVVCVYGGVPKDEQRRKLKTADVVVATPGRLNDLVNEGYADLSKVAYIVLDEADRMLDKGFEKDIERIFIALKNQRQTVMFTATWPTSVQKLAASLMSSSVKISIGENSAGEDPRANTRIVQKVEVVDPRDKEYRLSQLLKQYQNGSHKDSRVLVFCLYRKEVTRVEAAIRYKGFSVVSIHGDLNQQQRTRNLDSFKQGNASILVATDVAARGLDIPDVKVVINCTFPLTVEDYVHRIGRTGRAGKEGLAITLFTEHDKALSGSLINVLKAANQSVPDDLLKFGTTVKKKEHSAYGAFFKDVDSTKVAQKIRFD